MGWASAIYLETIGQWESLLHTRSKSVDVELLPLPKSFLWVQIEKCLKFKWGSYEWARREKSSVSVYIVKIPWVLASLRGFLCFSEAWIATRGLSCKCSASKCCHPMWGSVVVAGIGFPLAALWHGWQFWHCKYPIHTYFFPGFWEALLGVKSSQMALQGTLGIHLRENILNRLVLLSWLTVSQKKLKYLSSCLLTLQRTLWKGRQGLESVPMHLLLSTEGWPSPMSLLDRGFPFGISWVHGP